MPLTNTLGLLNEICTALEALKTSGQEQILYLMHPPLTEEDEDFLREALGTGRTTIVSDEGTITAWRLTGIPCVWWGEYRDEIERVILKAIEIAPFPHLATSQREDIDDGLAKLKAIQQGGAVDR
jgi:HupH hydrogenase expression protein, C-terminal conserved region